jgi:hypothetical protein
LTDFFVMADTPEENVPPSPPAPSEIEQNPPSSEHETVLQTQPQPENDTPTIPPSPSPTHPPGSSASIPASIADSIETITPTLGGSNQTQVNVVNRGFTPRPSTADKPNAHQFYANLPLKRHGATDIDNESLVSRSTAQRTTMSVGGSRRTPSRSHIPAIMPAYSFYHPLRPPAVANASGQQQIPQTKPFEEPETPRPATSPATSQPTSQATSQQTDEASSMRGKPSIEPLLPRPLVYKEPKALHPVFEVASTRTSMLSTQLLGTSQPVAPHPPTTQANNGVPQPSKKTRNWEHFPGKTKYHLHGRVQFGTQYIANIATAALIIIPTSLYFAFTYSPLTS